MEDFIFRKEDSIKKKKILYIKRRMEKQISWLKHLL